jgi:hypothetical protein
MKLPVFLGSARLPTVSCTQMGTLSPWGEKFKETRELVAKIQVVSVEMGSSREKWMVWSQKDMENRNFS